MKIYTQKEAQKMDKELDIVHKCLTELYNNDDDRIGETIRKYLDKIEKARKTERKITKLERGKQVWRKIEGFNYTVNTIGDITKANGTIINQYDNGLGYMHVSLYCSKENKRHSCYVHRLIAQAFIPNPENKRTVNHKNGIKNDNRLENLEWMTYKEQEKHAVDYLGKTYRRNFTGEENIRAKLTEIQVKEIRRNETLTPKELSEKYKVKRVTIYGIKNRHTWKHI